MVGLNGRTITKGAELNAALDGLEEGSTVRLLPCIFTAVCMWIGRKMWCRKLPPAAIAAVGQCAYASEQQRPAGQCASSCELWCR